MEDEIANERKIFKDWKAKCWSIICIYVEIAKDSDGVILGTVTEKVNAITEKRENGFEDNEWQLRWGIIGDII